MKIDCFPFKLLICWQLNYSLNCSQHGHNILTCAVVLADVPSPTRYDPKSGDKAKGCVISKGERERTTSSTSDTHSTGGTPFRTVNPKPIIICIKTNIFLLQPFSVVKKHSCVASHEKSEKSIVARGMNFGESGLTPLISFHPDYNEEALRAEIASKSHEISEFKKLVDDLSDQVNFYFNYQAFSYISLGALCGRRKIRTLLTACCFGGCES